MESLLARWKETMNSGPRSRDSSDIAYLSFLFIVSYLFDNDLIA